MPVKVILAGFFWLLASCVFAQKSETDSLESLVHTVPADTNKVLLLNRLVNSLREKNNNRALEFAKQAKDLAELLAYKRGLCIALENLGWIYYRQGDFSQSLDLSGQALKLSEEMEDAAAQARCLINVAAIYHEQKQFDHAIDHFRKAYRVSKSIGDRFTMARSYNNIAYTLSGLKQFDSAFVNVQVALRLSQEAESVYLIAFAYRTLGDVHFGRQQYKDALRNFYSCYELSIRQGNTFLKSSVLHRIAKVYHVQGMQDKSLVYLFENIAIAKQFGFKDELERAYKLMSEVYYKKDELAKAYEYQSRYTALHDSLYNQRSAEQIALMQTRFDSEMKEVQIGLLTKDAALKEEEIKRQRVWIYFYVGCLSLLGILAFVLYYNNRYNRRAKVALEEKNESIQSQAHQLRNLNSTKDKLFSIISHDLRSPVASLKALLEIVGTTGLSQEEFVDISKVLKRNLDSVHEDLDNLLLWAQTQLKGLKAVPEEIDLREAAETKLDLFRDVAAAKKITLVNDIPHGCVVEVDRNHLNLVLRNLLANAVKFNRPHGKVVVKATAHGDECEISVSDSGVGISFENIEKLFNAETHFSTLGTSNEKGIGIGLLLTKEFVEKNQGRIWASSEVGNGTTFTFTLRAVRQAVVTA